MISYAFLSHNDKKILKIFLYCLESQFAVSIRTVFSNCTKLASKHTHTHTHTNLAYCQEYVWCLYGIKSEKRLILTIIIIF